MTEIQRGFRGKLGDSFDLSREITVSVSVTGGGNYDSCCFGVDSSDKLSDERYMVFYNQTSSPNREIALTGSGANTSYAVNLSMLPAHIFKLVFTVSIDGNGVMGQIGNLTVLMSQGPNALRLSLDNSVFRDEKAVIAVEIYKKEVWRVAAIASGFNGGLSALLSHFGGEEAPEDSAVAPVAVAPVAPSFPSVPVAPSVPSVPVAPQLQQSAYNPQQSYAPQPSPPAYAPQQNYAPPPQPAYAPPPPGKISLEKRLEAEAPQLLSLVKPLKISLEKHNLTDLVANVALLIDVSGSMRKMFKGGLVQNVVDRIVPLAMQFDDNGEFELWYFGSSPKRLDSVNSRNYSQATVEWQGIMSACGGGTNLAPAISDIVDTFENSRLPVYVLCITDGATISEGKVKKLISAASSKPIFWQFIGIGNGNYGILHKLDTMKGRVVDNANFFTLDDLTNIDDTELYTRMLAEFPIWLNEARRMRIIP